MARVKTVIDGEHASVRIYASITPLMEQRLDFIAAALGEDKSDILRRLIADYTEVAIEKIQSGEITNETIERVLRKQATK